MIAVDTNVLVHADREELPLHAEALAALRSLAEGNEAWGLPVFCIGEFLRIVSHPRVFHPPTPVMEAFESMDALLSSPSVRVLWPGSRFLPLLHDAVRQGGASGNLVFDAMIAAVCLEHGARTLLTEDRDLTRFPGLAIRPIADFALPDGG